MDLHSCAVKYIKSCFMLCEHAANQENSASWCYKVLLKERLYVFWQFWGTGIQWDSSLNSA